MKEGKKIINSAMVLLKGREMSIMLPLLLKKFKKSEESDQAFSPDFMENIKIRILN